LKPGNKFIITVLEDVQRL